MLPGYLSGPLAVDGGELLLGLNAVVVDAEKLALGSPILETGEPGGLDGPCACDRPEESPEVPIPDAPTSHLAGYQELETAIQNRIQILHSAGLSSEQIERLVARIPVDISGAGLREGKIDALINHIRGAAFHLGEADRELAQITALHADGQLRRLPVHRASAH